MPRKKTHAEFVEELRAINPAVIVLGEYEGVRVPVKVRYAECLHETEVQPETLLKGKRCKRCALKESTKKLRKTHERFVKEVRAVHGESVVILGRYVKQTVKIRCKCKTHGVEYDVIPSALLIRKTACPVCEKEHVFKVRSKTFDEVVAIMRELQPQLEVIGPYKGNGKPLKCLCRNCGSYAFPLLTNVMKGQGGCRKCGALASGLSNRVTHEEFIERVRRQRPNIKILSKYTLAHDYVECACVVDGHTWKTKAEHLLAGHGCVKCASSEGEKLVAEILDKHGVNYVVEHTFPDCRLRRVLPFDFYLPEHNIAIEFDGLQHFEPVEYFGGEEGFKKRVIADNVKTKYCRDNKITLLRIPYWTEDVEKVIYETLEVASIS